MIPSETQAAATRYLRSYLEENATLEGSPCGSCEECRERIQCREQYTIGDNPRLAVEQLMMDAVDPSEFPYFLENYFEQGPQPLIQALSPLNLRAAFEAAILEIG